MSDIQRGVTFTTSIPDAPTLHNLVDQATILPAFISGKTVSPVAGGDSFVFLKGGSLRQCTLNGLVSAFPSGTAANVYSLRKLGTTSFTAAAGNDVRFPANLRGVRKANFSAADTVATAPDLSFPSANLTGVPVAGTIDLSVANIFYDNLATNKTYTFANATDGRSIQIIIKKNGHVPTLPGAIGTVVVGAGTTFLHCFLTSSALGITGLQIAI